MRYTAKKIGTLLLTLVLVSLFVFLAFSLLSGDAATRMLGTEATPERLEALRAELELDKPLPVRYVDWISNLLRGDMGTSYQYRLPVAQLVAERLRPSLTMTVMAFALIVLLSIPVGVVTAKYAGGWLDRLRQRQIHLYPHQRQRVAGSDGLLLHPWHGGERCRLQEHPVQRHLRGQRDERVDQRRTSGGWNL